MCLRFESARARSGVAYASGREGPFRTPLYRSPRNEEGTFPAKEEIPMTVHHKPRLYSWRFGRFHIMKSCLFFVIVLFLTATARASFPTNDPVANIHVIPACSDTENSNFIIKNDNPFSVTINYSGGPIEGSVIVWGKSSQIIYLIKDITVSFTENGVLFKELITNDQKCTDHPFPYLLIEALPLGSYGGTSVYSVTNHHNQDVDLTATTNGGSFSFTLPALGSTLLVTPGTAVDLSYDGALFATVQPSGVAWSGCGIITATALCADASTAVFTLQNNDSTTREAVLRNSSGTEHRYTLRASEERTVIIENTDWEIRLAADDLVGSADRVMDDHFRIGSVSPGGDCVFAVSPAAVALPPQASGSGAFVVISDAPGWTAASDQAWVSPDKTEGTGCDTVTLIAQENTGPERTAVVTVTESTGGTKTVAVTQTTPQAVTVQTLAPTAGGFYLQATLKGTAGPNGETGTAWFEVEDTVTSDVTVVAATPATVGGSETVDVTGQFDLPPTIVWGIHGSDGGPSWALINDPVYHPYRCTLAVENDSGTFYGNDLVFDPTYDERANIHIIPVCSDTENSNFIITNDNPFRVTINYSGGPIEGSVAFWSKGSQIIYLIKDITVSFTYKGLVFKELITNDQKCTDHPFPYLLIEVLPLGTYDGTSVYSVTNNNGAAVGLTGSAGGSSFACTVPALSTTLLATPGTAVALSYDGALFATVQPSPYPWSGCSIITAAALYYDAENAAFELQNNDDTAREVVLRNGSGTEHRYVLGAYEHRTVTIENTEWEIRLVSTGVAGAAGLVIDDHFRIGSVSPGGDCRFSVSPATIDLPAHAHAAAEFTVASDAAGWTVASDQAWISPDTTEGTGCGTVTLTAQQNNGPERTAVIIVTESTSETATITVRQAAAMTEPGNALHFDGVDDYVEIPDNDAAISSAITLETWVLWQPDSATDVQFICGKAVEQFEIHTAGGAGANGLRFIPTSNVWLDATNVLPAGVWTHVAVVYAPGESLAKMYINGNEVALTSHGSNPITTPLTQTADPFNLGRRGNDPWYYFKGALDEFRVWNKVRSQAEIQVDYQQRIDPQSGLIDYYNFNLGTAAGDNAGVLSLIDGTDCFDGTLHNSALSGADSNWTASYAMVVPVTTAATDKSSTGFTANWTAPTLGTVTGYYLDVAEDSGFSSLVEGYNKRNVGNVACFGVTGLTEDLTYYYRVRAYCDGVAGDGAYSNITSATATVIELASFTATPCDDHVLLAWETASEMDNAGFHLWRAPAESGDYRRITPRLIPADGGPAKGAQYTYEDAGAPPGMTSCYELEDIDSAGMRTFHGPVSAWAGVVNIQVNGSDDPAIIPSTERVSVKVSVRSHGGATDAYEWWLCCNTPLGWFSFMNPDGWVQGIRPAWVNPRIPVQDLEVFNGSLPIGVYTFHFALDPVPDHHPAPDWIDSVEVRVEMN